MQEAGADAIELNLYGIPTDLDRPGEDVERELLEVALGARRDPHSAGREAGAFRESPEAFERGHYLRAVQRSPVFPE